MKKIIIILSITIVSFFMACKSTKSVPVTTSPTGSSAISTNGIMTPTHEQVLAIRSKYSDIKLEDLSEGYKIYTGACSNGYCHGTHSIYERDEQQWIEIIDRMAPKAYLTKLQTDQLTKYIMSIKASKPKVGR